MQMQGGCNGLRWYQNHQEHACKPEILEGKFKSGKTVSHQSSHGNLDNGCRQGNQERNYQGVLVIQNLSGQLVIICGKMLRNVNNTGVKQISLCHKAYGNLIQYGLQNQEAHTKEQKEPADGNTVLHNLFL